MPLISTTPIPDDVRHRIISRLMDRLDAWWMPPAACLVAVAVIAFVVWLYRRDVVDLRRRAAIALAGLRVITLVAIGVALLDIERIAEHEIVLPSRVAVVVDSSASMSLDDDEQGTARSRHAIDLLTRSGLLTRLRKRHDVTVWRFDADVESLATLPTGVPADATTEPAWADRLAARGYETRLGEAVLAPLGRAADGTLAGVVVVSDGGHNAGVGPRSAASAAAAAGVSVHTVGVGSDVLPANVRVSDVVVPARVFPGDRFPVTAFLQANGLAGARVRVTLAEASATVGSSPRPIDTLDAVLAGDGDLVPIRFDVPGLKGTGRRVLVVSVSPPAGDSTPGDDTQSADVEVVDRVTQVLLMAGGPSREYQFMRNLLQRDASFVVDVLLATAVEGVSQDARRVLDAFPGSDAALADYDAVVAFDYDWRDVDPASQSRLERWVADGSGGLMLIAGGVFTEGWLADPRSETMRSLHPVELPRTAGVAIGGPPASMTPRPLRLTRDGMEAEFLRLAATPAGSDAVWGEFPGVYACLPSMAAKPGATVYATLSGREASGDGIYLAGQFYGSGIVISQGSGELWRLRGVDPAAYERLVPQLLRHVSQGRLARGSRRGRLIVDRDRVPVGGTVRLRVLTGEALSTASPGCHVVMPDGTTLPVPLAPEAARPGTLTGAFVASHEGPWEIVVEPIASGDAPVVRRIQAQLPDRELRSPRLERDRLARLASETGGVARFLADGDAAADVAGAIVEAIPDRTRREFEAGAQDVRFKRRLNTAILVIVCGCLCVEWAARRLARLA